MDDIKVAVSPSSQAYKLNVSCLRRLKIVLKILFTTCSSDSLMRLILLLALCVGQQLIIYNIGLLPSKFFKVLGNKDHNEFKPLLFQSFFLIILISLCNSAVKLASGHLYLYWRETLTNHLHEAYFTSAPVVYNINLIQRNIDNVDQRIAQDVNNFCLQLRDIVAKLVISPLTIGYYSVQCFKTTGYTGPVVIYTYFIIGTIVNKFVMSSIVGLVFKQEKCEGDFRYWHTVVRSYAESISFLKGEKVEYYNVGRLFRKLLDTQLCIVNSEVRLNFVTNFFDYVGSILSYIIISVPIFAGKYDSLSPVDLASLISKNAFVSIYLISCFSTLIDLSVAATDIFGYTHRIGELIEGFDASNILPRKDSVECINTLTDVLIRFNQVSYSAPDSTGLFLTNLSISIERNKNLLITGNTGVGKSSILRVLLGIWKKQSGSIEMNIPREQLLYLPQKPFLTNGSLIDQIIYPSLKEKGRDYLVIHEIIEDLGLQSLRVRIGGIDNEPVWNWSDGISPGEIQRLSFARVCYHQPILALLDEPSSALGINEEKLIYDICMKRGTTFVTVGHRDSLKKYHDVCLEIKGSGDWKYYDL